MTWSASCPSRWLSLTAFADDHAAAAQVLADLDPADRREAELCGVPPGDNFAVHALVGWREGVRLGATALVAWSHVPGGGAEPFALIGASPARAGGVVDVGLLARDHLRFRRPLARLVLLLREKLPEWAKSREIIRLEARSMFGHPTAPMVLGNVGFAQDTVLPHYGVGGAKFTQWSMLIDLPRPQPHGDD